ncbi:hypothetical protein BKA63DRAFT_136643 [Paraphoma chrysanthemicola]|nr:hypothetical protein BKA63DRAFT_136643 [Paraphoma chrysanthemicola]
MSEPSETSGRLLPSEIKQEQHPEGNTIKLPSPTHTKYRNSSNPSDDSSEASKPTKPRRRPGTTVKAPSGPHAGSSRSEQRSSISPANMLSQSPSVNYTRTGRISKAKKGLKVHNCQCGRSYTRAEHLRRHQKNHAQDDALVCEYPDCGKTFYRMDLLQRHQERHNEPGKESRQHSVFSAEGSPARQMSVPVSIPTSVSSSTIPPTPIHYSQQPVSPLQEPASIPRYTFNPFRTPQVPRTPRAPSSAFISRTSPTSSSNDKQQHLYSNRLSAAMPIGVGDMTPPMNWEPYSQSPGYSCSSGYASPNPGPCDYPNVYAPMPYGHGFNRTRTSSNASFDHWSFTPRSPTSSASTMPYAWASNDKTSNAPHLAYMGTSYSMNSLGISTPMDPMSGYGQFEPKTMMQRDEEEGVVLFPEQPYGMGQIEHTYPSEQYLNSYWRLFHPTFPIVHRSAFASMSPMLRAAMIAIGGQYSNDTSVKHKARKLHDQCIKVLDKRVREHMAEPDRLCDYQAVFLVEALSQYRARRAAKQLTPRFGSLYHKTVENFRFVTSQLNDIVASLSRPENVTPSSWSQWIELSTWHRLLVSCYILECQQALSLAREPQASLIHDSGLDMPFPAHTSVWDAYTLNDWATAAQRSSASPRYVYEVHQESLTMPCDSFQSSLLLAAYYNRFNASESYLNAPRTEEIDHVLDGTFATRQKLLTAKLLQVTPIRALLAVSGESWILSEKVPSQQAFAALKTNLRTWVAQLWSTSSPESPLVPIKVAMNLSIDILQMALKESNEIPDLEMGVDMGIYFASLVLWAATSAFSSRSKDYEQLSQGIPQSQYYQSTSILTHLGSISLPSTPTQLPLSFDSQVAATSSPIQPTMSGLIQSQPESPIQNDAFAASALLSHEQITFNCISFLPLVSSLAEQFSDHHVLDLGQMQTGCISMLLWAKLQLRGASLDDQIGLAAWAIRPGEGLGELLDSIVGSLERILNRGWSGWGI